MHDPALLTRLSLGIEAAGITGFCACASFHSRTSGAELRRL